MSPSFEAIKNLKNAFLFNRKRTLFLLWLLFSILLEIIIVLTSKDEFKINESLLFLNIILNSYFDGGLSGFVIIKSIFFSLNLIKNQTNQLVVFVSILTCGISMLIFWLSSDRFMRIFEKWENRPKLKFVLIGSLGALWVEFLFWAFEKLLGGVGVAANPDLFLDWLVTMPWYIMMIILIWKIQTRYQYSLMEMAFFGGIYESFADGVLKMIFTGQAGQMILLIPVLPMFVIAYCCMILPPTIITRRAIEIANSAYSDRSSRKRFVYGWIPLLGLIPYFFFYLLGAI